MTDAIKKVPGFDREHTIETYRDLTYQCAHARNPETQQLFANIATRLRSIWRSETGVDDLHQVATGEPLRVA